MRTMMNKVCLRIRNYFPEVESHEGHYKIENQEISLPFCEDGDYILIEGSKRNNGILRYTDGAMDLKDEEFHGRISVRAVPEDFVELVEQIDAYMANHTLPSEFTSESFGGYSYSRANGAGGASDWADVFRSRLNAWRKI